MLVNVTSFILLLLALNPAWAGPNSTCKPVKKSYYASSDKVNYYQAFINCKQGGMNLASVENVDESNALNAYLDPYKSEGWDNGFWLSGTNYNNVASFQYYWLSTGKRAIFTNWLTGQPDNANGQQHVMTWVYFQGKIGWADDYAELPRRYVCEYTTYA